MGAKQHRLLNGCLRRWPSSRSSGGRLRVSPPPALSNFESLTKLGQHADSIRPIIGHRPGSESRNQLPKLCNSLAVYGRKLCTVKIPSHLKTIAMKTLIRRLPAMTAMFAVMLTMVLGGCDKEDDDDTEKRTTSYDLQAKDLTGVAGKVTFTELSSTVTIIDIEVTGSGSSSHPANIHLNSQVSGGSVMRVWRSIPGSRGRIPPKAWAVLTWRPGITSTRV